MEFKHINYTLQEYWVEIVINRPEVYNALNLEVLKELFAAFEKAGKSSEIRCVVLTGMGAAFCSGQDLKAVGQDLEAIPFREIIRDYYNPLILKMQALQKPIICKLNGLAAGAGCSLALASDVIVASKEAYLPEIFAHIGLVMDAGGNYFLPKRIGYPLAFELATTGRKVYAEEAEKIGLVNKAVEHDQLDAAISQYVEIYVNASAHAVGLIKEMLHESAGMSLQEVLDMEMVYQHKAGKHQDFIEGITAFIEKRKPRFNS
ncbi:2-(1,2-epoxy-1,2-dihydrophenyl)acetyl-CoA isomerase [Echinicola strongylocentroti]|uniref:2-(1,2-epoxy-1,2-dihydrophenyl)acetyl-CoA isomerase n=1 Tax=Echinicola strongylocentroti TaxID=1795355 RepID=A0A2Z4IH18_9BACT|nr:enoyl-CoA hydratase-related protein [Echinicola strongylocentroti]AWW29866.1 2-(1,2-epoxy-1,2-dihydrophenyl)acetyl-CoA isomerase [Echinicola strongylocentroti]